MSLRLFQIMAGARHGGAEAFFTRLAVALQDVGLDQQVAVRPHPERLATLRHAGIPVLTMRFGGPLDLMTRWRLERAVRTYAPQIVLAWMSRAASFTPAGGHLRLARLGGYYNIKYYRGFDHLIGNTRDIVDYIIRSGWEPRHVHYLPNFVELTLEPPIARATLCTPEEAPLVLALGRLHRNKAFDVLIEAMNRLDGVYLWLAGEGSERKTLEDQVRHHGLEGRVRFLGWRSDISALLAAADVLVCPSRHEPLGNVVLEGWAAGKPVVAAASTGPASLITEGKTGLLVPVEDAEALAAALHCVTGDRALAADLGKGGFAAYEAGYTKESVVAEYLKFFDALAEARRCAG